MQKTVFQRAQQALGPFALAAMLAVSVVAGGTAIAEPAAAQPAINGEFVARLGGTDAFAGIVAGQGKVLAYVCNGTDTLVDNLVYSWFQGNLTGDFLQLTNPNGLTLELFATQDGHFDGRFILADGTFEDFTTARATEETGLFINEVTTGDQLLRGGWIVENNFEFRGQITLVDLLINNLDGDPGAGQPEPLDFLGTGGFDPFTHVAFFPVVDQSFVVERVSAENILDFLR